MGFGAESSSENSRLGIGQVIPRGAAVNSPISVRSSLKKHTYSRATAASVVEDRAQIFFRCDGGPVFSHGLHGVEGEV